jgi:hypothetical protein
MANNTYVSKYNTNVLLCVLKCITLVLLINTLMVIQYSMKTKDITPEQQIAAQKAWINSLSKELERLTGKTFELEEDLKKCIEEQPEVRTEFAAKLEEAVKLTRDALSERLYNTIHAAFLPVHSNYNKEKGSWDLAYGHPWWYFRDYLFQLDEFENHWQSRDFRLGVDMLNDICQATEDFKNDVKHFDKFELGYRLFYSEDRKIAVHQLICALSIIIKVHNDDKDISVDELELIEMMEVLKIIQACQSVWHQAGGSEREKTANEWAEAREKAK